MKAKVERQITKMMIPFAYNAPYRELTKDLEEEVGRETDGKVWRVKNISGKRLFHHIDRLIQSDPSGNQSIGSRFVLTQNGCTEYDLPNKNQIISFGHKDYEYELYIREVSLILFETQIGFVTFSIAYPKGQDLSDLIQHNYYVKQFLQSSERLVRKLRKNNQYPVQCNLGRCMHQIFKQVQITTLFESRYGSTKNVLVYNAITLEEMDQPSDHREFMKSLYLLSRTYHEVHNPPRIELHEDEETMRIFQNSYWRVSVEGIAHVCHLTNNKDSNEFLLGENQQNLNSNYFYMYVLTLHQFYSLQYFSILASHLPHQLDGQEKQAFVEVRELKKRMVFFTLRCSFKQISRITHIARLYEMVRRSYRIEELMDELHLELDAMTTMLEMEESKRRLKLEQMVLIFSFFYIMISTLADGWDIVRNTLAFQVMGNYWIAWIEVGLLLGVMAAGVWSILSYYVREKKRR
ncbi:hypothetical protein J2Z48_000363 [Croceifilum oryzae]|uniref:CorA-like Mg2+ transporter protein n=1 Tax=Croceifilum oryzae TaxID=1553429 RepID=A0AAJ1TD43_9BACL|nr:hypothetical protein [Croceifilum oryzae]MDQ0416199.1 hypothetical protein [Croceifilum oryzae]